MSNKLKKLALWKTNDTTAAAPVITAAPDTERGQPTLSVVDEHAETSSSTTVSPSNLAQRLRDLIDPLPFPSYPDHVNPPKLPPRDKQGRPIIPKPSSPIKDPKLLDLLTSSTFMNGPRTVTDHRRSVWDILEGLTVPPHAFPDPPSHDPDNNGGGDGDQPPDDQLSTSSVMVYSPLIPGKDDIVEIGELLPVSFQEERFPGEEAVATKSWASMWPLSLLQSLPVHNMPTPMAGTSPEPEYSGDFLVYSDVTTVDGAGRRVRVKSTSAWIPSNTKVSFQAMWWGYRLWLPPPVMSVLSDQSLEAAKRATLIATTLAWFFNNLPVNLFPPQVRPALLLMQRIVPYLGYIATFISWSWGSIKGYDIGHGVTLTATWLLPFALIPGTWQEQNVPKSPMPSPPISLPGNSSTSPPPNLPSPPPPDTQIPPMTPPSLPSQPDSTPKTPISNPTVNPTLIQGALPTPPTTPPTRKLFGLSMPIFEHSRKVVSTTPPVPIPREEPPPVSSPHEDVPHEAVLHAPSLRPVPLPNVSSETLHKKPKRKRINPLFRPFGK